MMSAKPRYIYIDLIKSIGILFVCMYHFWYGSDISLFENMGFLACLHRFLYGFLSICVPLFFVANGALLLNKPFHAQKHYRTLCVMAFQLFLWRLITLFSLGAIQHVDFGTLSKSELFNLIFFFGWTDLVRTHHLWFIPMLISIQLMYPFIKKCFDEESSDADSRIALAVSVCVLFFLSFVLHDFNVFKYVSTYTDNLHTYDITSWFDPFAIRVGSMLTYFILGGYLQKYRDKLLKIPTAVCILSIFIGMVVSFAGWRVMSSHLGYAYDNVFEGYGSIPILICTISVFILALKLDPMIAKSKRAVSILSFIGNNTLSVYYLHWILGYMIAPFFYALFATVLPIGIFGNLLIGITLVLISTFIGTLIKKIPMIGKYVL